MIRIGIAVFVLCILPSLPASALESDYRPYMQCVEQRAAEDSRSCLDNAGRGEQPLFNSFYGCIVNKQILELADRNNAKLSWEVFFMNERCRMIDEPFYRRADQRE